MAFQGQFVQSASSQTICGGPSPTLYDFKDKITPPMVVDFTLSILNFPFLSLWYYVFAFLAFDVVLVSAKNKLF